MKRTFDILLSLFGIVAASPLLAGIALGIKLTSPGPVLYRGKRVGRAGKDFHILKFRSMVVDAEQKGASSTSADDVRITRIGKFIRRTKMDELPQLFNVLFGQMSFVGPRPQVRWAVDLYSDHEQALLDVRPGITDYASLVFRNEGEILKGSSDPDRDYLEKIAPKKISLGLAYVQHHSLWTDVKIITATALALAGVDPSWCLPPEASAQPQRAADHHLALESEQTAGST